VLETGLYLKPEECEFHKEEVRYLGLIISTKGISMDKEKVQTVRNWSWEMKIKPGGLNNLFDVWQLLGFCNYYKRFITKYSEDAEPFTRLTKKDEPFVWELVQQLAFETMLMAFTRSPTIRHCDSESEVIIQTDAMDYVSVGVTSQQDNEGVLHPVANFSKKHTSAECNYDIYGNKLMAIIKALEEWRPECEGAEYPWQLMTDTENLEYFMRKKVLNQRQAWWSDLLTCLDYQIVYRTGKSNGKVDVLTRRLGDLPEGGDERLKNMELVVFKTPNIVIQLSLMAEGPLVHDPSAISALFNQAFVTDPLRGRILEAIQMNSSLKHFWVQEGTE
jgi:hypothetical protein